MSKPSPNCVVRFKEEIHKAMKLQSFKEGKTLQEWAEKVIENYLYIVNEPKSQWLCQKCGGWTLKGTQVAMLGKCELCRKEDAVFPMWEKK